MENLDNFWSGNRATGVLWSAGGQVLHSYISLPMSCRSIVFMGCIAPNAGLRAPAQARVRIRPRTLPTVWRRVEDHRRHRGACGDSQDPHASGLAGARATARTGADCARAKRVNGVEQGCLQPMRESKNAAESKDFTEHPHD